MALPVADLDCDHGARVATDTSGLVQHAYHVSAIDAVIDHGIDALVSEVVGDGQALDPTTVGQGVADEIHAPDRVGAAGLHQRLTLGRWPPDLPAATHGEVGLSVQAIDLLFGSRRETPDPAGRAGDDRRTGAEPGPVR